MAEIEYLIAVKLDSQGVVRGARVAHQSTEKVVGGAKAAMNAYKALAATAGAVFAIGLVRNWGRAVTQVLLGIASQISTVGSQFQQLRAQLETVTGSRGAANAAFDRIKKFAAETPFEVDRLTEAFIKLRGAGIQPTERILTSFGNIAAAKKRDITDFADAVRGALTGEMERLKGFDILARQHGESITFMYNGMETTIRRDAASIVEHLTRMGEVEFASGMTRQAATVAGGVSNWDDAQKALFDTIAQRSGLLVIQEQLYRTLAGVIGDNEEMVGDLAEGISGELLIALENGAVVIAKLIDMMPDLDGKLLTILRRIQTLSEVAPIFGPLPFVLQKLKAGIDFVAEEPPGGGTAETDVRAWFKDLRDNIEEARRKAAEAAPEIRNFPGSGGADNLDATNEALKAHAKFIEEVLAARKAERTALVDLIAELETEIALRRALSQMGGFGELRIEGPSLAEMVPSDQEWTAWVTHVADDLLTPEWKAMTVDLSEIWDGFLRGMQGIFRDTFRSLFDGTLDGFEDLWDAVKALALDTLAEIAAQWATKQFTLNVVGGGGSGGGSFFSSLFGAGGSAATGAAGSGAAGSGAASAGIFSSTAVQAAAIIGAYYVVVDALLKHQASRARLRSLTGQMRITLDDLGQLVRDGFEGGIAAMNNLNTVSSSVVASVTEILRSVDGSLASLPNVRIEQRLEWFRVYVDGFVGTFKDVQLAVEAAITAILQRSEITGISENVRRVLERSTARTVEDLQAELATALSLDRLDWTSLKQQARSSFDQIWDLVRRGLELGLDVTKGMDALGRTLAEAAAHVSTEQEMVQINEEIRRARALIEEQIQLLQRQIEQEMRKTALHLEIGHLFRHRAGANQELIRQWEEQLVALRESLANLPEILTEIPAPRGGGRGAQRQADRERLRDLLDRFDIERMDDVARAIAEINRQYAEQERLAHGDAELIERNRDQWRRALAELGDDIRNQLLPFFGPGGPHGLEGGQLGMSDFDRQALEIRERYERLREANQLLLEETGERAVAFWQIQRAELMELAALAESVAGELGLPLEQTRERFARLREVLDFLAASVDQGAMSAERFADVMAQTADQQFLAIADGITGLLQRYYSDVEGFDEIRIRAEEIRFRQEILNLEIQIRLAQELGLLLEAEVELFEGFIDWANDNMPDFAAIVGGGNVVPITSHPGFGGGVSSELQQVRDLLDRYISESESPLARALAQIEADFDRIRRVYGNTAEVQEQYALAIARVMRQHLEGILQLQQDLLFGSGSPLTSRQQLDLARDQFEAAMQRFRSGDTSVIQEIPAIVQRYLQAARDFFPAGSAQYEDIFRRVNLFLQQVLSSGGLSGTSLPAGFGGPSSLPVGGGALPPPVPAPSEGAAAAVREGNMELRRIEAHAARMTMELRRTNDLLVRRRTAQVA